jgi:hypothetical protein
MDFNMEFSLSDERSIFSLTTCLEKQNRAFVYNNELVTGFIKAYTYSYYIERITKPGCRLYCKLLREKVNYIRYVDECLSCYQHGEVYERIKELFL